MHAPRIHSTADIERLVEVLGPVARLTYAPPNIYPMSAPQFSNVDQSERHMPDGVPWGVYIHIPFCNYHCNFCFYATKIGANSGQMRRYVDALRREAERIPLGTPLTQLFVGGGTPTALPASLLDQVLDQTLSRFDRSNELIHTVECSPESLSVEHLTVLASHGIGRVSMGIQSLSRGVLETVDRDHSAVCALEACRQIVDAGRMLNVDLIYGLPGQSHDDFRSDFSQVVETGAHSVTAYNLRVNERTPVARHVTQHERLDIAGLVAWRMCVRQAAAEHNLEPVRWHTFRRRDISADHPAARHEDRTGWGNQFGIGMSARSRSNGTVFRNHARFDSYLERIESDQSPVEEVKELDQHEQKLRHVALTLGDGRPLNVPAYQASFGSAPSDDFDVTLTRLIEADLIVEDGVHITLTDLGQLVYDLVTRTFYPETVRRWLDERQSLVDRFSTPAGD